MVRATNFKSLAAGFHEEGIRPLARQGMLPGQWSHPEPDWDKFRTALDSLLHRIPMLGEVEHGDLITGVEAYTPDKSPIIGESSQVLFLVFFLK